MSELKLFVVDVEWRGSCVVLARDSRHAEQIVEDKSLDPSDIGADDADVYAHEMQASPSSRRNEGYYHDLDDHEEFDSVAELAEALKKGWQPGMDMGPYSYGDCADPGCGHPNRHHRDPQLPDEAMPCDRGGCKCTRFIPREGSAS
jgi:hypothetical protein